METKKFKGVLYTIYTSMCHNCRAENKKLYSCGICKNANYCSKECQISHWKIAHKIECPLRSKFDLDLETRRLILIKEVKDIIIKCLQYQHRMLVNGTNKTVV